ALKPLVLGSDPLSTEVLWYRMYHQSRDYGRKGSVIAGISAIDMALWDIAGQYYGVPVHQLLGGAFRTQVQPYATGFYRIGGQGESARLADEALAHHAAGFRLMKVKLGYGVDDDKVVLSAIAKAVQGMGVTLMVALAQANGIEVNPHVWGSAIAQAASLQVIAALPVAHHSVFPRAPVLEYDRSLHPFRRELVAEPIELENGLVSIPQKPGLGINVRRETIERYRIN
ncbi:MAG: mandelate racemase/muconate lactonizing enzyme family protein, partial [Betaproteobacteria bacterium]|nr:mandelate racemase/muconate lactonizing enzyme family protein [Betaproteobacteria bacterium]